MKIALEMLTTRGHRVTEIKEDLLFAKTIDDGNVIVKYFPKQKFSMALLSALLEEYEGVNFSEFIIICESVMKKNFDKAKENGFEIFTEDELQFNILKHFLQPKFKRLENFPISKTYLPQMKQSDAVAKFLNFKEGDVIQIETTDGKISYRIVVP
jgi:DNA-directed RNA polymerase subunit H (RpoH/RPB5)